MIITIAQLNAIMPLSQGRAGLYCRYLNDAMEYFDITSRLRVAAFLANVCVESGSLQYTCELASGHAYDQRSDLGNLEPEAIAIASAHGKTAGQWFRGHGLIQLTGYYNHLRCGAYFDIDLLNNPLLLTQPEHAANASAWFWHENNINKYADIADFDGCCDKVNRGRKTTHVGDSNGWPQRLAAYNLALDVITI